MSDIDNWQKDFWNRLNQQMQENFKKQMEFTEELVKKQSNLQKNSQEVQKNSQEEQKNSQVAP